jgi:hypothetical protein
MPKTASPVVVPQASLVDLNFPLPGISLTYLFTFDLGSLESVQLTNDKILDIFSSFTSSSYVISDNEIRYYNTLAQSTLETYKSEMYERRFKNSVLPQRASIMLQLPVQNLAGILHPDADLVPTDHLVKVEFTCTLNAIGVGFLAMWIHLEREGTFTFDQLYSLRDSQMLSASVDWRMGPGDGIRLLGRYCFVDLAKFVIIAIYCALSKSLSTVRISQQLGREPLEKVHAKVCEQVKAFKGIDHYLVFHVNLTEAEKYSSEIVSEFVKSNAALLRGLVTADANWSKKKPELVNAFVDSCSFSTRSTIFWLTHPNGSIKIYASDLETPLLISKILIVFELELVLTMRFCLHKLISNLNALSSHSRNFLPIRRLTKLRDQELRRLDDYYNLDILQKDTTENRLSKFQKMLKIDDILQIADRKFNSVNSYMMTEYQNASAQRQFALTIIFGIFGAGTLTFHMLREAAQKKIIHLSFWEHLGGVAVAMSVIVIIIYLWFNRRMRMQ